MDIFEPNQKVRTNDEYYAKHKRIVHGVVIEPKIDIGDDMVIVRWFKQIGEINFALNNQMVLMHKEYLELE